MSTLLNFAPRSKRKISLKALYDYRSGVRVLACDELFDIAEPHASELEGLMAQRRHGFGHLWPVSKLSAGLVAELRRVGVPTVTINGVLILPADFRVVGELPPTVDSMAVSELARAA